MALLELPILLVEDEPTTRKLLATYIGRAGHRAITAASAEDALALLKDTPAQAVVTDLGLPGMDGIAFIEQLKTDPATQDIPILVVSSAGDDALLERAFGAGAFDFMTKASIGRELLIRLKAATRLFEEIHARRTKERELEVNLDYLNRDLQIASKLQRNLLPENDARIGDLCLEWFFEPCDSVGGDVINYFPLNDHQVAIAIVDVAGHGVSAALNAIGVNAALVSGQQRGGLLVDRRGEARRPEEVLEALNNRFQMDPDVGNYFTMTYCVADYRNCDLRFAQAGHPGGFIVKPDGIDRLDSRGKPVGMLPGVKWQSSVVYFEANARMLFFTDGLTELRDAQGGLFGEDRLTDLVERHRSEPVSELSNRLQQAISEWRGGVPQDDDISFVLFERTEEED